MEFSLLYPQNAEKKTAPLTPECINDLSIEFIIDALTNVKYEKDHIRRMMTQMTDDEEVIRYRCDVFDDFLRFPVLREKMEELTLKLKDLQDLERFQKDQEAPALWSLINRLREIDDYVSCINMIKDTLLSLDIQSDGMKQLFAIVTDISKESGFEELKADIDETLAKASRLRSITIGVNLDSLLRPKTAGIVSLNTTEFTDSGLMKRFMTFAQNKDDLNDDLNTEGKTRFHPANPSGALNIGVSEARLNLSTHETFFETSEMTGGDPLSNAIKKPVTNIMKRTVNDIKSTLKRYVNVSGYSLISLLPEILFYVRWAELTDKILATGMPMCKAKVLPTENREILFKDIYNLKLAINKVKGEEIDIITNDLEFNDDHRIFILTGPNRGGKTIFTQAVGFGVLLAQLGLYVPASEFALSPCDNIFTHFPADENDTVDLGRLGEESQRLSQIFDVATGKSMLLLNESLATTSVAEGLFIAKDVVKAMRYLGCRCIFNTHMHDLARHLDTFNQETEGDSKVESLVTGVYEGHRSFKVSIIPPQGMSYAKDIAEKYGVTYENIKRHIDDKATKN
ncbi:MAG: hypothetical protein IJH32_03125 [Ruminococcus sp.]|nr:hypothetical protein [Ruminococcus sp.]